MRFYHDKQQRERDKRAKAAEKQSERARREKYSGAIVSDSFVKVKRRFFTGAIVKSIICGVSAGLLAAGILLLVIKLNGIPFNFIWYIVAGVVCAGLCGAVTFLFLKPSNKRVAKTVDEEFGLKEQVQTSLAFSRRSGEVINMQRERAESAISALPRRKFKFSRIWQYIVIAVLAVALMLAAIIVPGKEIRGSAGEGEEPGISVGRTHIATIEELINYVRGVHELNYIGDELSDGIIGELEKFKDELEDAYNRNVEVVPSEVTPHFDELKNITVSRTNYMQIAQIISDEEIKEITKLVENKSIPATTADAYFGKIIQAGGDAYRTFRLETSDEMDNYHSSMEANVNTSIANKRIAFIDWLVPTITEVEGGEGGGDGQPQALADTGADEEKLFSEVQTKTNAYVKLLTNSVGKLNSANLPNREIVDRLLDLCSELNTAVLDNSDLNTLGEAVKKAFNDFLTLMSSNTDRITETLARQSYYMALDRYIENRIRLAFGMPVIVPDVPEGGTGGTGSGGTGTGDEPGGGGGGTGGSGNLQYPSDDSVYDYRSGSVDNYSKFLADYFAMMQEFLRDNENLTEKQRQMIQAYFNALYGNSAEE